MNGILAWFDEMIAACEKRATEVDDELKFVYLDSAHKNREARAAVAELMEALRRAEEMLLIAGPLVGEHAADSIVHYDGADCDGTCIQEDCRDAADHASAVLTLCKGEKA